MTYLPTVKVKHPPPRFVLTLSPQPFATDAVKTAGQAKSPAGVFGVTIEALSGAFLKTRVVTVWPRFVVRNNLGRKVGILSTVEPPPKRGKDHGQSIAKATKVGEVLRFRVGSGISVGAVCARIDGKFHARSLSPSCTRSRAKSACLHRILLDMYLLQRVCT